MNLKTVPYPALPGWYWMYIPFDEHPISIVVFDGFLVWQGQRWIQEAWCLYHNVRFHGPLKVPKFTENN